MSGIATLSYLFVRATGADVLDDDLNVILSGHPLVPDTWDVRQIGSSGWYRIVRPDGYLFHARRLNTSQIDTGDGVWLVFQRRPFGTDGLADLAALGSNTAAASVKTTWTAALAGNATAREVLRHVPDWKVSGFADVDGETVAISRAVVRIFPPDSGQRLPADAFTGSGPWHLDGNGGELAHGDPAEALHVTAWHRPAMGFGMAGYDDGAAEEGTPEP